MYYLIAMVINIDAMGKWLCRCQDNHNACYLVWIGSAIADVLIASCGRTGERTETISQFDYSNIAVAYANHTLCISCEQRKHL